MGGQRHPLNESHQSIEGNLSQIQFNAQSLSLYRKILEKIFDKENVVRRDEITKTENEVDRIVKRLATLKVQFLDGNITPEECHSMKEMVEKAPLSFESCNRYLRILEPNKKIIFGL